VTTVWIYVDTSKDVGDRDHLKVFADEAAAEAWFRKHDPEGVALVSGQSKQSRRWGLISGGFSLRMMSSLTHESRWLTRIVNRQFAALSSASGPRTQRA
jgi:hypothetical protein